MELQLCEERRQMEQVESEVKKRLLESTTKVQQARQAATTTTTTTTRNTVTTASPWSSMGDNCRRTIAQPRTARNKLMKYGDKFRRS